MVDLSNWFSEQLRASLEGFVWAVKQVPAERRYLLPPRPLGTWPAARHAFHLMYYEQTIALPSMGQWLGGGGPARIGLSEEAAWEQGPAAEGSPGLDELLAGLREVRESQLALLPEFDAPTWEQERMTVWGVRPLRWVVTKTFQHTAEHTHDVLSLALYWDMVV
jgi:hypothetical protein